MVCDNLEGWDGTEDGREAQDGGGICIPVTDSCWCMTETNTILWSNYLPIKHFFKKELKTRMVVQWLRICQPMQGTWVQSPVREDSTCHRAAEPMSLNCWASALELAGCNYWSPLALELTLCNKRSLCNEKPLHHQWRVAPTCCN